LEETIRALPIFALLTLVAGLARAEDLKKLTLDDASVIGTTIQTDIQVKAEGKGSIKITTNPMAHHNLPGRSRSCGCRKCKAGLQSQSEKRS
jgi:hypothetical protein